MRPGEAGHRESVRWEGWRRAVEKSPWWGHGRLVVSLALCRSARGAKGRAGVLACALQGVEEVRLRLHPYVFICTKIFLRE